MRRPHRVRVTKGRKVWRLRWVDGTGREHNVSSGVPVGESARQQRASRAKAERVAAARESELQQRHGTGDVAASLDAYSEHLAATADPRHVQETVRRARRICRECRFSKVEQISSQPVRKWLARLKRIRAPRTCNTYLSSIKAWLNWLVEEEEISTNPIGHLRPFRDSGESRPRRALSADELRRLIESAAGSEIDVQCLAGPARALLYVVAAWTGLRRKELAAVTIRNLDLAAGTLAIEAGSAKNRKKDTVPLHPSVVEAIRDWLAERPTIRLNGRLFELQARGGGYRRTAKMVQHDLAVAREAWIEEGGQGSPDFLAYTDSQGRWADFHSLRHTYITSLALAGVPLSMAQRLARHSDPKLTAAVYTHLELDEQADAVRALPAAPRKRKAE